MHYIDFWKMFVIRKRELQTVQIYSNVHSYDSKSLPFNCLDTLMRDIDT